MAGPSSSIQAREPSGPLSGTIVDRSADAIGAHLEDAAHFPGGRADAIAQPRTEADIAALLAEASSVLAVGAQSSVTGGATPTGGLILSTARLTRLDMDGDDHVRAGAGVPLSVLQKFLAERGRWFPPVPTFNGAFVGGVVATNAAGAATYKYGTTRAWVDGLTVVLACGHVLDLARGHVMSGSEGFVITCPHGTRTVTPGTYRMPPVAKCSAGYFAAPEMDLIDLFIGAEGTLGVIAEARLRVLPAAPSVTLALIPARSESAALALVDELRRASQETWRAHDPHGIDVAAIEYMDARSLQILREDGVDRRNDVTMPADATVALLLQLELPAGTDAARMFDEIGSALAPDARDSAVTRFCRLLDHHGVLEDTELAMPGDARRAQQLAAFREGVPEGVNRRIGEAKRTIDKRIEKAAADMIVPFEKFADMMECYREGYRRRNLDFAIWGHVSDGNVHPTAIPRAHDDVIAAKDAVLEFGREVVRLGGSPLAEHGVGRSAVKQALLRQLYGDDAIEQMRAIKRALDPEWKLAPGVLFAAPGN
jgi:D-lactate dehydrogenase (cytochrome)